MQFSISDYNVTFYDIKTYNKLTAPNNIFQFKRSIYKAGETNYEQKYRVMEDGFRFYPLKYFVTSVDYRNVSNDMTVLIKNGTDICVSSSIRGFGFIIENFKFCYDLNYIECYERFKTIAKLIVEADKKWKPETNEEVENGTYLELIEELWRGELTEMIEKKSIELKRISKNEAKKQIRYKYRIGDMYSLRYRTLGGDRISDDVYVVKKVIHSIGANIVNILVMKKIYGNMEEVSSRNTLSLNDCRIFHIKYEPGLLVFNMNERLYKVDNLDLERKLLLSDGKPQAV